MTRDEVYSSVLMQSRATGVDMTPEQAEIIGNNLIQILMAAGDELVAQVDEGPTLDSMMEIARQQLNPRHEWDPGFRSCAACGFDRQAGAQLVRVIVQLLTRPINGR